MVIVDGAERLNMNAANALLKSLEEPPSRTLFFLTTSLPDRLLPTIRSRCRFLPLSYLSREDMAAFLEAYKVTPDLLPEDLWGSPGQSLRFLEKNGVELYEAFHKVLNGVPPFSFLRTCTESEETYELVENLIRTLLHKALLAKTNEKPSFFDSVSLQKSLEMYHHIIDLFDQCRFAQLDRKASLCCIVSYLAKEAAR